MSAERRERNSPAWWYKEMKLRWGTDTLEIFWFRLYKNWKDNKFFGERKGWASWCMCELEKKLFWAQTIWSCEAIALSLNQSLNYFWINGLSNKKRVVWLSLSSLKNTTILIKSQAWWWEIFLSSGSIRSAIMGKNRKWNFPFQSN